MKSVLYGYVVPWVVIGLLSQALLCLHLWTLEKYTWVSIEYQHYQWMPQNHYGVRHSTNTSRLIWSGWGLFVGGVVGFGYWSWKKGPEQKISFVFGLMLYLSLLPIIIPDMYFFCCRSRFHPSWDQYCRWAGLK